MPSAGKTQLASVIALVAFFAGGIFGTFVLLPFLLRGLA